MRENFVRTEVAACSLFLHLFDDRFRRCVLLNVFKDMTTVKTKSSAAWDI